MTFKNVRLRLMFVLILCIFPGCGRSGDGARVPFDPSTLTYAMYTDINEWDPAVAFSTETVMLLNVYETLVYYVPEGNGYRLRPGLATHWEKSADGLSWIFQLRQGVRFHDGKPLTAEAVKFSIERTKEMGLGAAFIWEALDHIEVVDGSTVRFHLTHEAPIDLIATSQYAAFIYSPVSGAKGRDWFNQGHDGGTGPFKVASWKKGSEVVLARNLDYWQNESANEVSRVFLKLVPNPAVRAQMISSGEADFIAVPSVDLIKPLVSDPGVTVSSGASWMNTQFLINTGKYPTSNKHFREALVKSFDYQGVVEYIYDGYAGRTNGMIPKTLWGFDSSLSYPVQDLEEARRLLEISGVPKKDWHLELAYVSTSSEYRNVALLWQKNLADIGVTLELKPGPWGMIWNQAKKQSTAPHLQSMTWWPTYPTPGDGLRSLFRTEPQTLFNLSHYSNSDFDVLVDEGLSLEGVDKSRAIAAYQQAQRLLLEDAVAVFALDLKTRLVHRSWIKNVQNNPAYSAVFFNDVTKEAS